MTATQFETQLALIVWSKSERLANVVARPKRVIQIYYIVRYVATFLLTGKLVGSFRRTSSRQSVYVNSTWVVGKSVGGRTVFAKAKSPSALESTVSVVNKKPNTVLF